MRTIITSDWHLRSDKPRCRLDEDWLGFQEVIVEYIINKANEYKCDIKIIGDIFDTPNVPSNIVSMFLRQVSACKLGIEFIAGNHDLPYHSLDNIDSSSIGIICNAAKDHLKIHHGITGADWMDFGADVNKASKETNILFLHKLVFESSKDLPPNIDAITAKGLLDYYSSYDWIFAGDNHKGFQYENNNRHVINCGCIIRQAADFMNYEPKIYFVDTDLEQVIEEKIPDIGKMVDDSYLREEEAREDRIASFVKGIKKNGKISLDFLSNINNAILTNKSLSEGTIELIHELIEE